MYKRQIYYDSNIATIGSFPESWNLSIRDEIAAGVKSLTVNPTFIEITRSIRATVVIYLLRPLDTSNVSSLLVHDRSISFN